MILQRKTLEKLRSIINEESEYRSGPQLVSFFNQLGFKDAYGQGFPSRWKYTDERLNLINGRPELDQCIKMLFAVVNYVGNVSRLDQLIKEFNNYLAFDKWKIKRVNAEIHFEKLDKVIVQDEIVSEKSDLKEEDFLHQEFKNLSLDALMLDGSITAVLKLRFEEIKTCLKNEAPLATIFLIGSTLEGILLGIALANPQKYNQCTSTPKDKNGTVKPFHMWTLSNFIDVSYEVGFLKQDVKKFSHALRDFRNYIHPYEQMSSRFNPDKHTASICWQVLKAVVFQLSSRKK
ncbi:hypothetical protein [Dyadobacter sp. CY347]|uniref:hypothetical protein n=1 Tax=Dyadobacter sp. CY347 TaxID=2909336 RepID=UPI001F2CA981|nr:hypothetical protein [Dyadobacter sp. CY347]MCF2491134.1 hypothetical protein [Dyadobacter sp. CY347]